MSEFSAYPGEGPRFVNARGIWVTDDDGRIYLDGCAGTFNLGLGYGNRVIVAKIQQVLEAGILHGSGSFSSEVRDAAEEALVSVAPHNLDRCHLKGCTGGSTAVEQAIRHAWATTGRIAIAGFQSGHHGQTILSTLVSGMAFRKDRIPVHFPTTHVPCPDCYRCPYDKKPDSCAVECVTVIGDQLERFHRQEEGLAAFVAEPILGAGGGLAPPRKFWSVLQEILQDLQVPLILDEVQTFGRTGHFLAAELYGIKPAMICLGKAISGIGIPGAGALLLSQSDCVLRQGERSLTWGASNLACAAIVATIDFMNHPDFFSDLRRAAGRLAKRLEDIEQRHDFVGCVRGVGLMSGLEIVESKVSKAGDPNLARKIIAACQAHGLLLRQSEYGRGSFVKIRPPLTITCDEVDELCDRLERGIRTGCKEASGAQAQ